MLSFVLRSEHDRVVKDLTTRMLEAQVRAEYDRARAGFAEEAWRGGQDMYRDLLARFHSLRLQGYVETHNATPVPVAANPDPAVQLIIAKSHGDQILATAGLRQLEIDRKMQVSEEEIMRRIENGETFEEEGVPG